MPLQIENLLEILGEQSACCGALLGLSREKKDVIIGNDVPALKRITRLENILITKNAAADKARAAAMDGLAAAYSRDPAGFTAGDLTELLGKCPESSRLAEAVSGIRETVAELRELNGQNRLLLESSLGHIDFSINLLKDAICGEPYYSASGEEMPTGRGFFDVRG